jgi:hypothetical protein
MEVPKVGNLKGLNHRYTKERKVGGDYLPEIHQTTAGERYDSPTIKYNFRETASVSPSNYQNHQQRRKQDLTLRTTYMDNNDLDDLETSPPPYQTKNTYISPPILDDYLSRTPASRGKFQTPVKSRNTHRSINMSNISRSQVNRSVLNNHRDKVLLRTMRNEHNPSDMERRNLDSSLGMTINKNSTNFVRKNIVNISPPRSRI